MSVFSSLLGRRKKSEPAEQPQPSGPPAPEQPVFVIGDLHGRADLLERMLELIDDKIGTHQLKDPKLVFVGDIVDRGPSSANVVRRMQELTREFPTNVICLMGNHEQMCLDFIDAPVARQARWLKNGGLETCRSFGVDPASGEADPATAEQLAADLSEAMGEETLTWLRARPVSMSSGSLHIVHAAADPRRGMDDQTDRVLIWGHPEFLTVARSDGQWVAHGHTVFDEAHMVDSRISVDTGAWQTGLLSAAMILPGESVEFLQATLV